VALAEENVRRGQALQSATASQVYAEHIAAMADMTSHMAHRIVNEMGAIRLAVQVLRRRHEGDQPTDDEWLETLEGISRNAEDTIALVRRIKRPFDKIETGPVYLDVVLENVLAQLHLPDDVTLVRHSEPDLPPVLATRQLAEVFHHLISNALDAMSIVADKRLTVRARCQGEDQVEVSVQDSGPGVPDHLRAELFRLGVTDKRNGLGYGLWWSKLYLARIGGSLEMDPDVRQGARFVVRLRSATGEGQQG
jgi:C4-dicarboxylate-specific signal transduction histidine kinase